MSFSTPFKKGKLQRQLRNAFCKQCCLWFGLLVSLWGNCLAAQSASDGGAPQYVPAEEAIWEFGLRIEATGPISGITATCPLPVAWPEQEITKIEELKSANVGRLDYDELPQNVRLLVMKVNRLNAGEVAEATVRLKVSKRTVVAPEVWSGLKVPEKPGGKIKPFLQASPYIEIGNREVKAFAESLEVDDSLPAWQRLELIYDQIRERIPYEFDPTIRTCMEAISRGKGDCEELSSLFIAVCRLKGIPARAVWIPEHTYPEFYLEDEQGNGHWYPCQLAGTRQFGGMIEVRPILQKGDKFKVPGNSQPTRYVQPTLVARDAEASPKLTWISRKIKAEVPAGSER